MRKRAAVVLAVLTALLVPALPASASRTTALSGRVVDEHGRAIAGATVRFTVEVPKATETKEVVERGLGASLACLFTFGFICPEPERRTETVTHPAYRVTATGRTDRAGRYVLRFTSSRPPRLDKVYGVSVTGPAAVRGTLPATTTMAEAYPSGRTVPAFRLWMKGAALDPVSPTKRRLRAGVPTALGRPTRPAKVVLVQGTRTAWSFGEVARDRDVDTRVAEEGTTGTQTTVTTRLGRTYVSYRSGVRPLTKTVRPLSRRKACYGYVGILNRDTFRECPLTDGRLADTPRASTTATRIVVDLGDLSVPEAYTARHCTVYGVDGSIDGEVFRAIEVQEKERRLYTGKPDLPVRYVRLDLGGCEPTEISVFGAPFRLPLPPIPPAPMGRSGGLGDEAVARPLPLPTPELL